MGQRLFVQVVGFSEAERQSLADAFASLESAGNTFALWRAELGVDAQVAVVDQASPESADDSLIAAARLIWVGDNAPAHAWRRYVRPVDWLEILGAINDLFRPTGELEFDLGGLDPLDATIPPEPSTVPGRRALIASADRAERLYFRARLALAELTQADEAENGSEALQLARNNRYDIAFLDFGLPGLGGWDLVREIAAMEPAIPRVIVTKDKVSTGDRLHAWRTGRGALMPKPLDPDKLKSLLSGL
jgi:CheY-like chemotaxis protein